LRRIVFAGIRFTIAYTPIPAFPRLQGEGASNPASLWRASLQTSVGFADTRFGKRAFLRAFARGWLVAVPVMFRASLKAANDNILITGL